MGRGRQKAVYEGKFLFSQEWCMFGCPWLETQVHMLYKWANDEVCILVPIFKLL